MKREPKPRYTMRLIFILFIIIELLIIDLISTAFLVLVADYVPFVQEIPEFVWLLLLSIVLGSALSAFLAKFFFDPVSKLCAALRRVSHGDFSVQLNTRHVFPEIRQINQDFNAMTQELSSTEILKTEFVSNVSHEFKTPINAIEGYATLLQGTDLSASPEQQAYIEKILFNTNRLSSLVGNILLLSKVDNQGIQSNTSTYRLDEQIRQSIVLLEPRWMEKENEFDVDLDRIEYTGNENLLMHVWNNLIENAIKYGPQHGKITIKLVEWDDTVIFTIDDEGPGIPEEDQQHIFDRFYQADSSRKTEGNGLGLALVKQILSKSGGSITVANLPEKGTRFSVYLQN